MNTRNFTGLMEEAGGGSGGGGGGAGTLLGSAASGGSSGGAGSGFAGSGGSGQGGGSGVADKPWYSSWIAPDGKLNKTALDALPDRVKPYKASLEKFNNLEDVLFTFGHSESLNGRKGLLPLPAHATDNDRAEFRKRLGEVLGVPEKPEGYGLKKPDGIPDERWNQAYVDGVTKIAHKHAISPQAMAELMEFDQAQAGEIYAQSEARQAETQKTLVANLQKEWGVNYDRNLSMAFRMAQTLGMDTDDPMLGNHEGIIKALSKAAGLVSEDKLVTGDSAGAGPTPTDRIMAIMNDPKDPLYAPYRDANHPNHRQATDLVMELTKQESARKKS